MKYVMITFQREKSQNDLDKTSDHKTIQHKKAKENHV